MASTSASSPLPMSRARSMPLVSTPVTSSASSPSSTEPPSSASTILFTRFVNAPFF
jgi:hypothetical protein